MQRIVIPSSQRLTAADLYPPSRGQKWVRMAQNALKALAAWLTPSDEPKIWRRRDPSGHWVWEIRHGQEQITLSEEDQVRQWVERHYYHLRG
ncbi:MAG: hypothetical protein Q6M04_06080 [Thermostichus sp. BF3_bins_97]